ncbi:MAG: hypothetical protein OEM79_04600 [Nitrosopumilus sp.]|nr:hypothetical protein [Nitrosopumilus sp.]
MDRIKRLSYEVLDQHKSKFTENFTDNKKLLGDLTIIRSKGLKNEIAGYITKFIKKENYEQELNEAKADSSKDESTPIEETGEEQISAPEAEEDVIEIGEEPVDVPETKAKAEEKTE